MSIITVPHPTLRQTAAPITQADKKVQQIVNELYETLRTQKNPAGVGLAAPQINIAKRLFATYLGAEDDEESQAQLRVFINPVIKDHDETLSFGPDPENPVLEGCLSIPELYGPVPRWLRIKVSFDEVVGQELQHREETFVGFAARVMQHEYDHLNGVLFTDYSLQYDLPIYHSKPRSSKLVEIDKRLVEGF